MLEVALDESLALLEQEFDANSGIYCECAHDTEAGYVRDDYSRDIPADDDTPEGFWECGKPATTLAVWPCPAGHQHTVPLCRECTQTWIATEVEPTAKFVPIG